jgi:hypothetical protein
VLGRAKSAADLSQDLRHPDQAEVRYLIEHEWCRRRRGLAPLKLGTPFPARSQR